MIVDDTWEALEAFNPDRVRKEQGKDLWSYLVALPVPSYKVLLSYS